MIAAADVERVLRGVIDPELGLDVVSLGMVRDVTVDDGRIRIGLTLTTATCPFWELFVEQVRVAVAALPGANEVEVRYVPYPPWHPGLMTPEARQYVDQRGYLPLTTSRNTNRPVVFSERRLGGQPTKQGPNRRKAS